MICVIRFRFIGSIFPESIVIFQSSFILGLYHIPFYGSRMHDCEVLFPGRSNRIFLPWWLNNINRKVLSVHANWGYFLNLYKLAINKREMTLVKIILDSIARQYCVHWKLSLIEVWEFQMNSQEGLTYCFIYEIWSQLENIGPMQLRFK